MIRHPLTVRLILAFAALSAAGALLGAAQADPHETPATIRLIIDYSDGVEKHFTRLPWRRGMTVLDAMSLADDWPRDIDFEHRGAGATAFLTSIDDLENEGGRGRNWLFSVNAEPATRSFGVVRVDPGDVIRWDFKPGLPEE